MKNKNIENIRSVSDFAMKNISGCVYAIYTIFFKFKNKTYRIRIYNFYLSFVIKKRRIYTSFVQRIIMHIRISTIKNRLLNQVFQHRIISYFCQTNDEWKLAFFMFHKPKDMRKPLQLMFIPPFIPFFKAREFFTLSFYKFLIGRKKIFHIIKNR